MIKNIILDFDGTLVDSMPTYAGVMLRILDECGVSYGDDLVKIITPLVSGIVVTLIGMSLIKVSYSHIKLTL